MKELKNTYAKILKSMNTELFNPDEDKYSGVFLASSSAEYKAAKTKVMIVGRETANWNTNNGLNTIKHVADNKDSIETIISKSLDRYGKHFDDKGSRGRGFKPFFFRCAKELNIEPESLIYANFFAWDYNGRNPLARRPKKEQDEIKSISAQLLSAQIEHFKPDFIIFTGITITGAIKGFFNTYFDGYETTNVIPKKLWEFNAAGATCFRIAHPGARKSSKELKQYQDMVIEKIKN